MDVEFTDHEPSFNSAQHDFGLLLGIARDTFNFEATTYSHPLEQIPSAHHQDQLPLTHKQVVQKVRAALSSIAPESIHFPTSMEDDMPPLIASQEKK